jgi:hypothetical protein
VFRQVISIRWVDGVSADAKQAVMDFADFASARTYVEHPVHQTYIRDHASKVVGDRVVVQHDWTPPS